jgi:hypothetical protein
MSLLTELVAFYVIVTIEISRLRRWESSAQSGPERNADASINAVRPVTTQGIQGHVLDPPLNARTIG